MAILNTNKTAFCIAVGAVLPTPPAGFVELASPLLIAPTFSKTETYRMSGFLNGRDEEIDPCATKVAFDVEHIMRTNNKAADALATLPEWGLLAKGAGFIETVNLERITYTNPKVAIPKTSALAYLDGKKFIFTESLSESLIIDGVISQPVTMTANFQGFIDDANPVNEVNPAVTLVDENALVLSCADILLRDGTCLPVDNFKLSMNPERQDILTIGGACGIKSNIITDYSMKLDVTFFVDSADYGREITDIGTGDMVQIDIKLGLDDLGAYQNGKSVLITSDLSKTSVYQDTTDKNLLKRTVTFRLIGDTLLECGKLV